MGEGDKMALNQWRKDGEHLPDILKDFYDAKDFFKYIVGSGKGLNTEISWIDGQIYVFDTFLHLMARYGYTLQKTRKKVKFKFADYESELEERRKKMGEIWFKEIGLTPAEEQSK
jgi:hypothetical protein